MTLRLALAALHLLALGIGLGAVWGRARALGGAALDGGALRRAFAADSWWGVAALLWIATGLWRLFAGTEKATGYYWDNHVFLAKLGMLGAILLLEVWPAVTLVRWRVALRRHGAGSSWAGAGRKIAVISYVQVVLVLAMVVAAVAMARGVGGR